MNKASRARRSAKYTTSMPSPALALAVPIPAAELSASRSASILARQRGALVSWVTSPWSPTLTGLGIAAIALALFLNTLLRPGWVTFGAIDENVARGEWILAHHAVQTVDPFSWWMGGKPWQNSEWLADVLFALAYRAFGWAGIVLLNSLATLALGLVVGLASARRVGGLPLLIATAFVVGASNFFTVFTLARPQTLALPLLAAWVAGLLIARDRNRPPPGWLLLIVMAWANIHPSFVSGLLLIGPFALEAVTAAPSGTRIAAAQWMDGVHRGSAGRRDDQSLRRRRVRVALSLDGDEISDGQP
jgi:hypothetical protein